MRSAVPFLAAATGLLLALTSCSSEAVKSSTIESTSAPTDSAAATSAPQTSSTTTSSSEPGDIGGTRILDKVGRSLALVETETSNGTAILLDGGYLITNAHVVDPYRVVSVTLDGEDPVDAPVVGVSLTADVALIGPITTDHPAVSLVSGAMLARGADLYLVGFPGDVSEPEVTIARGVLSRRRQVPEWKLELIQTDAAIGSGQSGGALVDGSGAVVGMSGYAIDQFALALDGATASTIVERILADGGDPEWAPLPPANEVTATTAAFDVGEDGVVLYVPASSATSLEIALDHPDGVAIVVGNLYGESIAINQAAADMWPEILDNDPAAGGAPEPIAETAPGKWAFDITADESFIVSLSSKETVTVNATASLPFVSVPGVDGPTDIAIGDTVEGVADFGGVDRFLITLTKGQRISLLATSALGDIDLYVYDDADPEAAGQSFSDGGGGIFDLDAKGTFHAPHDGTFAIDLFAADGVSTRYQLKITEG